MSTSADPKHDPKGGVPEEGAPGPSGVPTETEAKLRASRRAFDQLEQLHEIAGWQVVERRTVHLRDTYWDTPDHVLGRAARTLRVRQLDDASEAELTLKGTPEAPAAGAGSSGSSSRTELTVETPAGSTPPDWARLPTATPVLHALREAGVVTGLRPDVVLLNPRRELVLRRPRGTERTVGGAAGNGGDEAVLSLDEVRIEGKPYCRRYVEIELKKGSRRALDTLVAAIAQRFALRPTRTGKVQSARRWLATHV